MRMFASLVAVGAITTISTVALADDIESGPALGSPLAPFEVCKIGGATDDGVSEGEELCYRCKYGNRPVVMVFSRSAGKEVVELAEGLDRTLAEHKDGGLAAFVNFLGPDREKVAESVKKLNVGAKLKHVALVVPLSNADGPEEYSISKDADLTVLICRDGKVQHRQAIRSNALNKEFVQSVIKEAVSQLN